MLALNAGGLVALPLLIGFRTVTAADLAIFLAMYVLAMVGLEIAMHRGFAHRAFESSRPFEAVLAVLGCMAGQGPVLLWATNHRKHHRFADQDADPHCPAPRGGGLVGVVRGLWHGHFAWHFRPGSAIDFRDYHRYARDLTTDRLLLRIDRFYWGWVALGLVVPALAGFAASGTPMGAFTGFLWGGPIRILVTDNIIWSINSIGHRFGRRPFSEKDRSTNVAWLAAISFGASWHNNHHAFPGSARVGFGSQVDPAYWVIRFFERVGLVRSVRIATPESRPT